MLQVESLWVAYNGAVALRGVSLTVEAGEIVAVIGANGAGKTTLFRAISGTVVPRSGRIVYDGQDLLRMPAWKRVFLGIAHVPQWRMVFPSLTVLENLQVAAYTPRARAAFRGNLELVLSLFPVLAERKSQLAGTLSGGEQQMLAIGRGLMASPRMLLLDEPSLGLAPAVGDLIFEKILEIHSLTGLTILLVEQKALEAISICRRGYVLENGEVVVSGDRESLLANPRVQAAYLGL